MIREALDYLKTQRIGVLAVEMPDGSPHAATVHYAHTAEPLVFYFETDKEYRKSEALFCRDQTRASFVIGFDEDNLKTLQMDGIIELLKPVESEVSVRLYFDKFPEKLAKADNPNVIFFKFVPTWWRFTDWTTPEGKKIWKSE